MMIFWTFPITLIFSKHTFRKLNTLSLSGKVRGSYLVGVH